MYNMSYVNLFLNFGRIKCQMARPLCTNALYRSNLIRSLFTAELQVRTPYSIKHLKRCSPSPRVSQCLHDLYISEYQFKSPHVSYSSSTSTDNLNSVPLQPSESDLPTLEQLQNIENKLNKFIQSFFVLTPEIPINGKTMVFINNLNGKNKIHRGPLSFALQKLFYRFYIHFNCVSMNVETFNSNINIADGTITIDWKFSYVSCMQFVKTLRLKNRLHYYGTCIAKVKSDGLIHSLYLERKEAIDSEPVSDGEKNKE